MTKILVCSSLLLVSVSGLCQQNSPEPSATIRRATFTNPLLPTGPDFYELGMLRARASDNLLDPASWEKSPVPSFWQSPKARAYGTGHNSFFKSPDGTQAWIIYHANPEANQGCGNHRAPRAQPFTWKPDGTPDFGRPLPLGEPIVLRTGEIRGDIAWRTTQR